MPRKRKVVYPPSRSSKGTPPPPRVQTTPPTVAVINQGARMGRDDIVEGAWVTITGTGSNAGESGRVERLVPGVIPAAVVALEGGRTRRVRTVDLVPSRRVEAPVEAAPKAAAAVPVPVEAAPVAVPVEAAPKAAAAVPVPVEAAPKAAAPKAAAPKAAAPKAAAPKA